MSGQAIEFTYKLDEGEFAALTQKLQELAGNKARTHIARALNKTATTARKKLRDKTKATHTVKVGGFNKEMTIKKASAGDLTAIIRATGDTLNVHYFKWSPSGGNKKGSRPVRVDVVKSGLKDLGLNGNKAFSRGNLVFARQGRERLPIQILKGPSVPGMVKSDRVWTPTRPEIESDLKKYMEQQIAQLVGGG